MHRIEESELILNRRGAVYHLDMRPEELPYTVITVGDPDRVRQVSQHFDSVETERRHREFMCHTGWLGSKRISVVSTGIGTDNIDIVLNELDALVNIDLENRTVKDQLSSLDIIRIGTAGSLQADIPVDNFVVSTHGLGLDNLLNYYRMEHNEEERHLLQAFLTHTQLQGHFSQPYICSGSAYLLKYFVGPFHHGITVTCPGFYGPQGRVLRLGLKMPNLNNRLTQFSFGHHRIANFEMETAGIYGLGKLLGHRCLSLSAIVANRVHRQFSKDSAALVEDLIQRALNVIGTII